jgi:hypothetical protein
MTDAELAFAAAEAEIAAARAEGWEFLDLSGDAFRALERIPESIASLPRLKSLDLDYTKVADLRPLSGLKPLSELRILRLEYTAVTDLGPLSGLTALRELNLDGTAVTDLTALSGLTAMMALRLTDTAVEDVTPLSGLTGLTLLLLANTKVTDLTPLSGLRALWWLNLDGTTVTDLRPLSGLTALTDLGLDKTMVTDLRPLRTLRLLVEKSLWTGLTFARCAATADPEIARIAAIDDPRERAAALFAYLDGLDPPDPVVDEEILRGPVLSDSLAEIEERDAQFHAVAMPDTAVRAADRRHDDLVGSLQFIAARLGATETQNRIGREVAQSLADYAGHVAADRINARILWFLAQGIRAVLADPDLAAALDGFDSTRLTLFLSENDALIRDYYPDALRGPQFESTADPETLTRAVPPRLAAAREILARADAEGIFAPSVSSTLEILQRRFDGARKGLATAPTEVERQAAGQELRRVSVQITAYLGRIRGRLMQWRARTGTWAKQQADHAREHPVATTGNLGAAYVGVDLVIRNLTPLFQELWRLIGSLPLPF